MHLIQHGKKAEQLLEWVSAWGGSGYTPLFSFIAVAGSEGISLVKGVLFLNRMTSTFDAPRLYHIENIVAGYVEVADGAEGLKSFCNTLINGSLKIADSNFRMVSKNQIGVDEIIINAGEQNAALFSQNRPTSCRLTGGLHGLPLDRNTDWIVKSGDPPFDSLLELASVYALGPISQSSTVEIVALQVAAISDSSLIRDKTAKIVLRLLSGLNRSNAHVGFRVLAQHKVKARNVVKGTDMDWTNDNAIQVGTFSVDVDPGDVVHCYAVYNNRAQHHYWVSDPDKSQNPRRAALEVFDPRLEKLRRFLSGKGKKQIDFEYAVSTLAWLLGFSSIHLERERLGGDAPDVILAFEGHVLLVECTTGSFGSDKVLKLIGRSQAVRQRLVECGYSATPVECVIVCSMSEAEAQAELKATEEHGVLLLGAETLRVLIDRSALYPDASAIYSEISSRKKENMG
jgi:hypothetical protein